MRSHTRLLKLGLDGDPVLATQLLQAYARLHFPGALAQARHVFDEVPTESRDTSLWTAMIAAYARSHLSARAALGLLVNMLRLSPCAPRPNAFACASAARAAASIADPLLARAVHSLSIKLGFSSNVVVGTAVLDMYSKCDDLSSSRNLFDEMPERNSVTWNSMISCYTIAGLGVDALELFHQLRCSEFELMPDEFAVASGLTACAGLSDLRSGVQIHGYIMSVGLEFDGAVMNTLANMYFRCGDVGSAERAMEGREEIAISKLMMIKGYVFNEQYKDAIMRVQHYSDFMEIMMIDPTVVVSILTACANLELLGIGRQLHGLIVTMGLLKNGYSFGLDIVVLRSALIDMYCKCSSITKAKRVFGNMMEGHVSLWNSIITGCIHNGLLEEARRFFDDMPERSLISWTTMISGYVQFGLPREGLTLLARFYREGGLNRGNCFTFVTALSACSCLAALSSGKQIHAHALRMTSEAEGDRVVLETALVDMYSKSGNLNYARKIFDRIRKKNVLSWTSLITGYAAHGLGLKTVEVLEQMMSMGFEPNKVTFIVVLSGCSHCGLVEQGLHYFKLMREKYGIVPGGDHISCMVDMLSRAGRLEEALNLVENMKDVDVKYTKDGIKEWGDSASIWGALLGGCWLHGNVKIGSKVAQKMLEKRQQTSDTYVALSNVYAAAEKWDDVCRTREEWRRQGVARAPGHSQIQAGILN